MLTQIYSAIWRKFYQAPMSENIDPIIPWYTIDILQ